MVTIFASLTIKKYDPKARKHAHFVEGKISSGGKK